MKKYILFLIITFTVVFTISCDQNAFIDFFYERNQEVNLSSTDESNDNEDDWNACDQGCEENCFKIYQVSEDENECTKLTIRDVRDINDAYEKMTSGRWDSINPLDLELIVSISYEPWVRRAKSSNRIVKNMLVWVAEISRQRDEKVSQLVIEDVLEEALFSLGGSSLDNSRRNIDGIKQALREELETSDHENRTFLEMLAWENNDEVFEKVHNIIKAECRSDEHCIKDTYCIHSNTDIVYEKVTELGLHEEFTSQRRFHEGLCT